MGLDRIIRLTALIGTPAAWATAVILLLVHALAGEIFAMGAATTGSMVIPLHRIAVNLKGDRADRAVLASALADALAILRKDR